MGRADMYEARYVDDPALDAGIMMMMEEIVVLSRVDYANAMIYLRKNRDKDPMSSPVIERKRTEKDCERFFLEEYEAMTGRDGAKAMAECQAEASKRETYINRKWSRRTWRDL